MHWQYLTRVLSLTLLFLRFIFLKNVISQAKKNPQKNRGGGGSGTIGDCFDAPLHIPNAFVVSVENKIHTVNIAC